MEYFNFLGLRVSTMSILIILTIDYWKKDKGLFWEISDASLTQSGEDIYGVLHFM